MNANSPEKSLIVADAHVHLYPDFDLAEFFHTAYQHFKKVVERLSPEGPWTAFLFLAETKGENAFSRFSRMAEENTPEASIRIGEWHFHKTGERDSLYGRLNPFEGLYLIAGRQVKAADNLEVLALGTQESFGEGLSLKESVRLIHEAGAMPVIPWGVGKWLGSRGRTIKNLMQHQESPRFFLGDSKHRPLFHPKPAIFKQAARKGIKILPGSDPLPFPRQNKVPGSYGFWLRGDFDPDYPLRSIKTLLLDPRIYPLPYGSREWAGPFLWNQFRLRTGKGR
jgi:hypothetical protein